MVERPRPVIARTVPIRSKLSLGSAKTGAGFGFGFRGKPDSNVVRSAGTKNPHTAIAVERAYGPVMCD